MSCLKVFAHKNRDKNPITNKDEEKSETENKLL